MQNRERVKAKIAAAFLANEIEAAVAEDIAFHMTDWKEDLEELVELYEKVDLLTDEQIRKMVIGFLVHVPNHVAAAKKLIGLGPIEDVFNVGVFVEDE